MGSAAAVSIEEYLRTSYDPDCDFVDGQVEERNVGERDHGALQALLAAYFVQRRREWGIRVYTGQRLRVAPGRYRIPDVCITQGARPDDRVFSDPPLICIEILSPDDRLSRLHQRFNDYASMGVASIWLIDPEERLAWTWTRDGMKAAQGGVLTATGSPIEIVLAEVFEALD